MDVILWIRGSPERLDDYVHESNNDAASVNSFDLQSLCFAVLLAAGLFPPCYLILMYPEQRIRALSLVLTSVACQSSSILLSAAISVTLRVELELRLALLQV